MSEATVDPANGPVGAIPPRLKGELNPHVESMRDFPDKLTPMLVKELRQGLRSPLFLWAFGGMHILLMIITLASIEGPGGDSIYWFWWSVASVMSLLMPLRGFNALIDEIRQNTLDTLVLTRLTAFRVAFGKWCCIAAQCGLVAITVLPYLILRYFGGGVNLWQELLWLFNFLVIGLVFAAMAVGFSWVKYFLIRGLFTLGFGFFVFLCCSYGIFEELDNSARRITSWNYTALWVTFACTSAYLIYYMLESAAAQIAPKSENRSSLRRLLSLAMVAVLIALGAWHTHVVTSLAFLLVLVLAGGDALTEEPRHVSVIVWPFVKRGFVGRLAGRFLYPGWHTGVFFFCMLILLGVLVLYASLPRRTFYDEDLWLVAAIVVGHFFLAALIQRLFFPKAPYPWVVYWSIFTICGVIGLLIGGLSVGMDMPGLALLALPVPLWIPFMTDGQDEEFCAIVAGIQGGLYALILIVRALREMRKTRALEVETAREFSTHRTRKPAAAPPPPAVS